jgi:hypothetical protein
VTLHVRLSGPGGLGERIFVADSEAHSRPGSQLRSRRTALCWLIRRPSADRAPRTLDSSVLYNMPRTATRRDLQRRMEPGVGVNKWLFTASIYCLCKEVKP